MILKYSDNPFKQILGIAFYSKGNIMAYTLISIIAVSQHELSDSLGFKPIQIPIAPISILGSALAIFLAFRNNSAYDRWWEARKIWGGIVNASRSWGVMVTSFLSTHYSEERVEVQQVESCKSSLVKRHICWLYALILHLRKQNFWDELLKYLPEQELEELKKYHNKPCQLLHTQSMELQKIYESRIIEDFRHMELAKLIKEFYDLQGKAERIKGTVFPYYYNYFTTIFLWLFIIFLPFAMVPIMDWGAIFVSIAISFVFTILEKSGAVTEDPFENRAADTPISTIARNIEIDLLEMIRHQTVPAPLEPKIGRFGVQYLD